MAKKKVFSIGKALSQGLEDTIEHAQNYSGELRVDVIPLSHLELDPENPRDLSLTFNDVKYGISPADELNKKKVTELESLQSLAHSIKSQGLINPITVYKHGEKYRLIAGERRTLSSFIAGKSDIHARILDEKPNELKVSLLQWIENIERSDLSLWERLTNIEKILAAYSKANNKQSQDIGVTELSNIIGCSKSHAVNYKLLLDADAEIKQLVSDNRIKNLEKAALLAGIKTKGVREQAVKACIDGATLKQLKSIVESNAGLKVVHPSERRGRQTTKISFGETKNVNVAKLVLESILQNPNLINLANTFKPIDWGNQRMVSEMFRDVLKKLEKIYS